MKQTYQMYFGRNTPSGYYIDDNAWDRHHGGKGGGAGLRNGQSATNPITSPS